MFFNYNHYHFARPINQLFILQKYYLHFNLIFLKMWNRNLVIFLAKFHQNQLFILNQISPLLIMYIVYACSMWSTYIVSLSTINVLSVEIIDAIFQTLPQRPKLVTPDYHAICKGIMRSWIPGKLSWLLDRWTIFPLDNFYFLHFYS